MILSDILLWLRFLILFYWPIVINYSESTDPRKIKIILTVCFTFLKISLDADLEVLKVETTDEAKLG